jgi:hypothetical protein
MSVLVAGDAIARHRVSVGPVVVEGEHSGRVNDSPDAGRLPNTSDVSQRVLWP